jgi:hypothetical protein
MGKVVVQASKSLDGFIADTNDQVGPLFDWYANGDVDVRWAIPTWEKQFRCEASATHRLGLSRSAVHLRDRRPAQCCDLGASLRRRKRRLPDCRQSRWQARTRTPDS